MTAPLSLLDVTVPPEWLDYNGHMNDATYAIPFSRAVDAFIEHLGMDAAYRQREHSSIYTLESHTRFLREAFRGEALHVDLQLVDHDAKRAHVFMRLLDGHGTARATSEQLLMAMDTAAGRPAPFGDEPAARLAALAADHAVLDRPRDAGRHIGIVRR